MEKNQYLVSYSLNIYSVSSDIFLGFSSASRKLSLKSGYFSYQNLLTGFHVFRWQMLQEKTGNSFFMVTDKLNFFSSSSDFFKKKKLIFAVDQGIYYRYLTKLNFFQSVVASKFYQFMATSKFTFVRYQHKLTFLSIKIYN